MSNFAPGRTADIQQHHLKFRREQSLYMRIREMEKSKPVESLGRQIANGIGWAVTLAAIILVTSWVN